MSHASVGVKLWGVLVIRIRLVAKLAPDLSPGANDGRDFRQDLSYLCQ